MHTAVLELLKLHYQCKFEQLKKIKYFNIERQKCVPHSLHRWQNNDECHKTIAESVPLAHASPPIRITQ